MDNIAFGESSGNVFRDFGYPDADVRQAKALMGTQTMKNRFRGFFMPCSGCCVYD